MSEKAFPFSVNPWSIVRENKEYSTSVFELFKRRMRRQSGDDHSEGDFHVLSAPAWVNVIPITPKNEIVLVEQFRYGIEQPTLEIPGGIVDSGESPLESAGRELLEETGFGSDQWSSLGKVSSNPAILDNYTHIYLAENCRRIQPQNLDEHEHIKVHIIPFDDFLQQIRNGVVHHAIVLAAVSRYLLNQQFADSKRKV